MGYEEIVIFYFSLIRLKTRFPAPIGIFDRTIPPGRKYAVQSFRPSSNAMNTPRTKLNSLKSDRLRRQFSDSPGSLPPPDDFEYYPSSTSSIYTPINLVSKTIRIESHSSTFLTRRVFTNRQSSVGYVDLRRGSQLICPDPGPTHL
jgi:hypothetical protein